MKRKTLLTYFLTAMITGISIFAAMALYLRPAALDFFNVDLNTVSDGEYIGICQNKILFAVVKVEIKDHRIANIDILEHKKSYMGQARLFADKVISAQSLEADAVSGATLTSDTVRKAIENALKQGE